jgi:acyl-CoA thioester hydrolase
MKKTGTTETGLTDRTSIRIRFSEVDALGIVWHGHFVKYLEDGRESFGNRYGLGYNYVYDQGWTTPVVGLEMDYKLQVEYGDEILIETTYVHCEAAKIIFSYKLYRKSDGALLLEARTTQVFLNREGILELTNPPFYLEWQQSHGIGKKGGA